MNVRELIGELEQFLPDGIDGEEPGPEVRLAIQPSWPFEHAIDVIAEDVGHEHDFEQYEDTDASTGEGVTFWECTDIECSAQVKDLDEKIAALENKNEGVVYIAEGGQLGYLPGSARDALGWGR